MLPSVRGRDLPRGPQPTQVNLTLDWKALGLDPKKTTLLAPSIDHYQTGAVFAADSGIRVDPGKGWLLIAEETPRVVFAPNLNP